MEYVDRGGVRLAYEEAGDGGTPVLLVHGMRCDHRHMAPLFDHLRETRRVVSVDLRGHGASDAPADGYTNEVMAGDLLWLCEQLGIRRPIAIGHSFGGSLALHIAATHPDALRGLVLLDSGVRTTAEKEAELGRVIAEASPADSQAFFVERLFGRDDDPALQAQIVDVMGTSVPDHAGRALGRAVLEFDSETAALGCTVPSLFILADRPFSTPDLLARLGPNWRVGQVVGAGHFVQLFATEQVNAMVDQYLRLIGVE